MANNTLTDSSNKGSRWLRRLVWAVSILVVLLVLVYFIATSSALLKGVILPKVSKALGAEVTLTDAQISPFSHVTLRGLTVKPPAGEPLLTVQEIHADYSLWSIIHGNIVVSEVVIESPVVTVVENADGTCNLDWISKTSAKEAAPATSESTKAPTTPQVDIKKVMLNNATVRFVKNYANGTKDLTEITGLNFSASNLKNGQPGKIGLAAAIALTTAAKTNTPAGSLRAGLNGGFEFAFTPDLKPATAKGNVSLIVNQATGAMSNLSACATMFDCELMPTDLKNLALRLTKAGTTLAQIHVSGPFDMTKSEGKLKLEISGIDRQALNLAGAASGMDFGTTTFNCTNDIELDNGGKAISLAGRFDLARLQIKQQTRVSPTLDLHGDYAVNVDQAASTAVLQTLNLTGKQDSRAFLLLGLSSPMTIGLSGSSNAVGDASLKLVVTNLNLADWKTFTGDSSPGGVLNLVVKLVSQKAGQQIGFQVDTHLDNLTTGTARVNQGNVRVQAGGSVADMKRVSLDNYQLDVIRQGNSLMKISGTATFDTATQDADLQVAVQAALAQLMAVPNASPTDGAVGFNGHVTSKQKKVTLTGELALTPTDRAKNILQFNGDVDAAQSAAITGNIKLAAESLDITRYYDLISSIKPAATNRPATRASAPPSSNPDKEPAAMPLPLKNFTVDLNIGHLFLREVDIADWQTTTLIDGGHIVIKPCQLTLNGAPIKATTDLNLGVPGYTYDVAFNADAIPLAPLVNSFVSDRKGQFKGTTSIDAAIKGAGITGASLQKNLTGKLYFATTNMDLAISNIRNPIFKSVINVITGLPDLVTHSPAAALGNLLGMVTKTNGAGNVLNSSPLDAITLQASAGEGKVLLQSTEVRGAAFQALASGQIVLAPVLTNSTLQIPVSVALSRSLAGQLGLTNAATPTNAVYVAVPDFLKVEGTFGKPQTKTDNAVLLSVAAKAGAGIAGKSGGAAEEKVGSVVNAIGNLLDGSKSTKTNSTAASTNTPPAAGLLQLFK